MTTKDRDELERILKTGTKVLLFNAVLFALIIILTLIKC
jgi:hypothetical protein